MIRKELISRVTEVMRENNVRKPVSIPKHRFLISDEDGNSKIFTVKERNRNVILTADDVENVLDACESVVYDALRHGEEINIRGFGTLCLNYRKPCAQTSVSDGSRIVVGGHYVPKFICGNIMKRCVQVYEQSLEDGAVIDAVLHPDAPAANDEEEET